MIRTTRDVPVLFNDTSLLSKREWRNRAIPVVDGFMFEAAETPEDLPVQPSRHGASIPQGPEERQHAHSPALASPGSAIPAPASS